MRIAMLLIGLFFGTGLGFLLAGGLPPSDHDHGGHTDDSHAHDSLTPWTGPTITPIIHASREDGGGVNLAMTFPGFNFSPEQVNGPVNSGTGHAHIYVNGHKVARAYSGDMHLTEVPSNATIRVTLNANDHTGWAIDNSPLAWEVTVP